MKKRVAKNHGYIKLRALLISLISNKIYTMIKMKWTEFDRFLGVEEKTVLEKEAAEWYYHSGWVYINPMTKKKSYYQMGRAGRNKESSLKCLSKKVVSSLFAWNSNIHDIQRSSS